MLKIYLKMVKIVNCKINLFNIQIKQFCITVNKLK